MWKVQKSLPIKSCYMLSQGLAWLGSEMDSRTQVSQRFSLDRYLISILINIYMLKIQINGAKLSYLVSELSQMDLKYHLQVNYVLINVLLIGLKLYYRQPRLVKVILFLNVQVTSVLSKVCFSFFLSKMVPFHCCVLIRIITRNRLLSINIIYKP